MKFYNTCLKKIASFLFGAVSAELHMCSLHDRYYVIFTTYLGAETARQKKIHTRTCESAKKAPRVLVPWYHWYPLITSWR